MMHDVAILDRPALASELRVAARLSTELRHVINSGVPAEPRDLQLVADCIDRLDHAAPDLASALTADLSAARQWLKRIPAARSNDEARALAKRASGFLVKVNADVERLSAYIGR